MAQNEEDSLNEEINESINKLDNFEPKMEEQPSNCPRTVGDRVICNYKGQQQVDSG